MRNSPSRSSTFSRHLLLGWLVIAPVAFPAGVMAQDEKSDEPNGADAFQIEEASIGDIQRAIRQGETTCVQVVEAYVERARAYNGMCTQLVTADGGRVAPGRGARCGPASPSSFPPPPCRCARFCRTTMSTEDCGSSSAGWSPRGPTPASSSSTAWSSASRTRASSTG